MEDTMISTHRIPRIRWPLLVIVAVMTLPGHAQETGDGNVLRSPADKSVAIRFFLQPPGDYLHVALVFRVVDEKDPRLDTAPILDSGRTAYITLPEMQQLLPAVTQLPLLWRQAGTIEVFGSSRVLPLIDDMDITIVSSHGTARALLDHMKICDRLNPLDSAFKTPRARWEFGLFRIAYGCKVPRFNSDAYPDHW